MKRGGEIPLEGFKRSFTPSNEAEILIGINSFFNRELMLIRSHRQTFFSPDQYFRWHESKLRIGVQEAELIAAVESSAHLLSHPELLHPVSREFPTLYRLLRVTELMQGSCRGGESVLIGSGSTVAEYVAMHIAPPFKELICSMFRINDYEDALKNNYKQAVEGNFSCGIQFTDGHITAIEPDKKMIGLYKQYKEICGIPGGGIDIFQTRLDQALSRNQIPDNLNTVLFHRAEPNVFYSSGTSIRKERRKSKRELERITKILIAKIAPGGRFIVTVGQGNTVNEQLQRLLLINDLKEVLPTLNCNVISGISKQFDINVIDGQLYSGSLHAMIGAVVAFKN